MVTYIVLAAVLVFFFFLVLPNILYITGQQERKVLERLGKFVGIGEPGLGFKMPFIVNVVGTLSLRVQQLNRDIEAKAQDDVFVTLNISVQYRVLEEKVKEAWYSLESPEDQIVAYILDIVRSKVPGMEMSKVFENKEEIAKEVKESLSEVMNKYGYEIVDVLVNSVDPTDPRVKDAMNRVVEAQRLRTAAEQEGEAKKIMTVKAAEAEAESKKLQGEGIANQRKAIADGLKESVEAVKAGTNIANEQVIMQFLMLVQFFDTMKEIASNNRTNTIFLPFMPGAVTGFFDQILTASLAATGAANTTDENDVDHEDQNQD